ncbi:MAG TPA: aminotransferase class I/II-fold pyridoxal phosphate-dependent enzyme, partial [Clostridia bacterium]|nr:aminotransferase class I/II-fold pyridoxal phosphate-dependent enzyme [Clostridia bacterium]
IKAFEEMGLPCFRPQGAFYVFPDISSTGLSSQDFCKELLARHSVACVPGDAFGESGEGYIRCCYATSLEKLQIALSRMDAFVRSMRAAR